MREAPYFIKGGTVYVYFDKNLRKFMREEYRIKGCRFVEYKVDDLNGGKVTLLQKNRICKKKLPYGGCGLELKCDDKHIISRNDFRYLTIIAGDENIRLYAEEAGYKAKEFEQDIKPYRKKLP
ncbi:hypothetical protein IKX12_01470 [Candidatus Saccharibacteria bacterium]|nr:hypothetical protein [Candidatus Saccharibacteria bacterium]